MKSFRNESVFKEKGRLRQIFIFFEIPFGGPGKALPPLFRKFPFFAFIFKNIMEPENVPLFLDFHFDAYKGGSSCTCR